MPDDLSGTRAGTWRGALSATDLELDARAVAMARSAATTALGALAYAVGTAESEAIRRELEAARDMLETALHDHIDPALHAVECRQADARNAADGRENRRALAWHHGRVLPG